jgi:uncharacterized protein YlaI
MDTEKIQAAIDTLKLMLEQIMSEPPTRGNQPIHDWHFKRVEAFIVALACMEKQVAKKVVMLIAGDGEEPFQFEHYICPNCKNIIAQRLKVSKAPMHQPYFCQDCGQALDWESEAQHD